MQVAVHDEVLEGLAHFVVEEEAVFGVEAGGHGGTAQGSWVVAVGWRLSDEVLGNELTYRVGGHSIKCFLVDVMIEQCFLDVVVDSVFVGCKANCNNFQQGSSPLLDRPNS